MKKLLSLFVTSVFCSYAFTAHSQSPVNQLGYFLSTNRHYTNLAQLQKISKSIISNFVPDYLKESGSDSFQISTDSFFVNIQIVGKDTLVSVERKEDRSNASVRVSDGLLIEGQIITPEGIYVFSRDEHNDNDATMVVLYNNDGLAEMFVGDDFMSMMFNQKCLEIIGKGLNIF